jgi:hypothetical protein
MTQSNLYIDRADFPELPGNIVGRLDTTIVCYGCSKPEGGIGHNVRLLLRNSNISDHSSSAEELVEKPGSRGFTPESRLDKDTEKRGNFSQKILENRGNFSYLTRHISRIDMIPCEDGNHARPGNNQILYYTYLQRGF